MTDINNPSRFNLYNYLYKEYVKNVGKNYNIKILSNKISSLIFTYQEYIFLIIIAHFNIHNADILNYKNIYNSVYNKGIMVYKISNLPDKLLIILDIYVEKLIDKEKKYGENVEIKLNIENPIKLIERNVLKLKSFSNFVPDIIKKPSLKCDVKCQISMLGDKYKILVLGSNNVSKKTTSLKCWWCKDNFTTSPVGIPIDYFQLSDNKHTFSCDQNCCSWECVLAIIDENDKYLPQYRNKYYKESRIYINWIFKLLGIENIQKANHWSELKSFSEDGLLINEFRSNNHEIKFTDNIILNSTSRIYSVE